MIQKVPNEIFKETKQKDKKVRSKTLFLLCVFVLDVVHVLLSFFDYFLICSIAVCSRTLLEKPASRMPIGEKVKSI